MKTDNLHFMFMLTFCIAGIQLINGAAHYDTNRPPYQAQLTRHYATLFKTITTNAGLSNEFKRRIPERFTTDEPAEQSSHFKMTMHKYGKIFASIHKEANVIQLWDAHTGKPIIPEDGKHVIPCGTLQTKFSKGRGKHTPLGPDYIAVSPDERFIAAAGTYTGVKLFDLNRPNPTDDAQNFINDLGFNNELAFTADSRRLISTSSAHALRKGLRTSAAFYIHTINRAGAITKSKRIKDTYLARRCIAPHPSPRLNQFAISSASKITVHDNEGTTLHTIESDPVDTIMSLKYSTDGNQLVSGGYGHTVRLWDVATGKPTHTFPAELRIVHETALSSNGSTIFGVTREDLYTEKMYLKTHPDGTTTEERMRVLKDDWTNFIHIWDVRSGKKIQEIDSEQRGITTLEFHGHNNLVSASLDGIVKIWSDYPSMGAPATVILAE